MTFENIHIGSPAAPNMLDFGQCTCIGIGAGAQLTKARRLILIGRDVGCKITVRPDTWEEFIEAVRDPDAVEGESTIFCWRTPMDEGLDFWGALRINEPPFSKGALP